MIDTQMLRTAPVDQLSLRRVAEQVGVSPQAPSVHFGTKRRFLADQQCRLWIRLSSWDPSDTPARFRIQGTGGCAVSSADLASIHHADG